LEAYITGEEASKAKAQTSKTESEKKGAKERRRGGTVTNAKNDKKKKGSKESSTPEWLRW